MKLNQHATFSPVDFYSTTDAEHALHYMQQSRPGCILKKAKQCHVGVSLFCVWALHMEY